VGCRSLYLFIDLSVLPFVRFSSHSASLVIIACDGLWDVMTNEQAVAIASAYNTAAEGAAALVDIAFGLGSGER
jgi:serine/threonine protein phosphatase PrpC